MSIALETTNGAPSHAAASDTAPRSLRPTKPLRVLQVHAYYQQAGGEDTVVAAERQLLLDRGHAVAQYTVHNDEIKSMSGLEAGLKTVWNHQTAKRLKQHVAEHAPDIIHAHNTFPLVSPALYYAAADMGIPVVQTLHNFRLLCPAAVFYREGRVCEDCLDGSLLEGVRHACYRDSRLATAAVAASLAVHRGLGTWREKVPAFIALTDFGRSKFIAGGLPPEKVFVKPNFLAVDPKPGSGNGNYILFVGRLSREKGILTLLKAAKKLATPIQLKIAGSGPLLEEVKAAAAGLPQVEVLGSCPREQVFALLREAAALVFPSEWYEGLSMTVIESLACATPVIASDLGSLDELIVEGQNGTRFETGSADSLTQRLDEFWHNRAASGQMRLRARRSFETRFSAELNYPQLLSIYEKATQGAARQ